MLARFAPGRLKDFRALSLGAVDLEAGPGTLLLRALEIPGREVADVRALVVRRWRRRRLHRGASPSATAPRVPPRALALSAIQWTRRGNGAARRRPALSAHRMRYEDIQWRFLPGGR